MDKISNAENNPVVFFPEGAPSQNPICRLLGFFVGRVFFAGTPLPFSISWRYVA
jgi:hypothetical protein